MTRKTRSRIASVVLVAAILATMAVGYVSAAEAKAQAFEPPYDFWMRAPGGGKDDTATLRTKESGDDAAFFYLDVASNTTDKEAYLNVRYNGSKVAGTPAIFYRYGDIGPTEALIIYSPGYGKVNDQYCPSCMTSSSSSSAGAVYFEGRWTP